MTHVMTFGKTGMEKIDPLPHLPLYCKVRLCNQGDREGAVISGPNEHGAYKCVTISNYDNRFFTLDTYCRPLSKKFGIGVYFYDSLETHDEAEVLDMIARAEAADTKRANDKAEAKAASDKLIIDLPAMYPHLKPLSKGIAYRDLKKEKKANMIAELKKHFPYVRFSVRNEYHDTYNIEWTDGPTEKEVSAVTNKFCDHKTDYTGDYYDPCPSEFNTVFGGFKFIFHRRNMSEAIERLRMDDSEQVTEAWRNTSFAHGAIVTGYNKANEAFDIIAPVKEEPSAVAVTNGTFEIIDYSEKAIAVKGVSKEDTQLHAVLKDIGGVFNFKLSCGPAWIFSKRHVDAVKAALGMMCIMLLIAIASPCSAQSTNSIPVKVAAGQNVKVMPVNANAKGEHVGYIQISGNIWPVYQGPRGGLFTYRANKQGVMTNYYLTDEQKLKMTRK